MSRRAAAVAAALVVAFGVVAGVAWKAGERAPAGIAPVAHPPDVPRAGAGDPRAELSAGAAAHPAAALVRDQVQLYFNAINTRDHATWTRIVSPERADHQPREQWLEGVGTTTDGTIRVDRIDSTPGGGVLALVRFVSVQDPADGPPGLQVGRICWQAAYPMAGSPPRLLAGDSGSVLGAPC
ncbi:hypothetical protein ACLFMI_15610 [Pseudonocardia nantongensis]|uniref:hypothetical protein n=1 Tax=Pseudonocardia nantongensis TaxID=1181885 RepID=UPI00397A10BA